jgi:hypothetical protein
VEERLLRVRDAQQQHQCGADEDDLGPVDLVGGEHDVRAEEDQQRQDRSGGHREAPG